MNDNENIEEMIAHRKGVPGGPCCKSSFTTITVTKIVDEESSKKVEIEAHLLNAEEGATEVELLRTIARGLGVNWGKDELGWWATVPLE